ncbi:hypothetical protein GWI33_012871, partial [Rhynchophorus ferrugineus]
MISTQFYYAINAADSGTSRYIVEAHSVVIYVQNRTGEGTARVAPRIVRTANELEHR